MTASNNNLSQVSDNKVDLQRRNKMFETLLLIREKFPLKEFYRFIVDGRKQKDENGWVEYEGREVGCLQAAFNGLAIAFSDIENEVVSIDLVKKLHRACTSNTN